LSVPPLLDLKVPQYQVSEALSFISSDPRITRAFVSSRLVAFQKLNINNMNIFLSSGFQPRSSTRIPPQPLDQPTILKLDQGQTGELLVSIKAVRKAKTYELRSGPVGAGGATPTAWTTQTLPHTRAAVSISGLTPGTTYAVQVRGYGVLGYTAWSDSAIRMVI